MVDFNLCGRRLGAVAIFATLFVALQVNGENGCVFDFDNGNLASDYDLECNGLKNSWSLMPVETESADSVKKASVLESDQEGCLRIKNPVTLNSTMRVAIRINRDGMEKGKLIVRLVPVEGTCSDEECVWIPQNVDEIKTTDGWVTLEHKFPLKTAKDCNIQLEIKKGNSKFELSSISIPNKSGKCRRSAEEAVELPDDHTVLYNRLVGVDLGGSSTGGSSEGPTGGSTHKHGSTTPAGSAAGFIDISKNFLFTSASVLILNHFLN